VESLLELEFMHLEKDGKLARLTLTRPGNLNAINDEGTRQLLRTAMALREDPDLRVVIIRGEGRAFCTGIDLKQYAAGRIDMGYHQRFEKALRIFEEMDALVLAGLHGYCLGGALQLALACDIRVSTPGCIIGLPAIRESLIPGLSCWRLPRYLGLGRAKKLILGGQNIVGEEALHMGLVDHLVPQEDFFGGLDGVARHYLAACSTGTRMSKRLLNAAFDLDYERALAAYLGLQERAQYSLDALEAQQAYRQKRDPGWQ